jgi:RNA polymerase sigma-B factor
VTRSQDSLIHLRIPPDRRSLRAERAKIADAIPDLRPVERSDLLVLVTEVVSAMVAGSDERAELDIRRTAHGLQVEVRGDRFEELDPLAEHVVDRIASAWSVEAGVARFDVPLSSVALGSESEDVLFARLAEGDEAALSQLTDRYLGFARSLARRFAGGGVRREDVDQVASMALVKALDRFDPERGVKFTTYAARTIDGELKRYLRDSGWSIRVPRGLQELGLEARDEALRMAQDMGREPTIEEVSEILDEDEEDVGDALLARQSYDAMSLDAPAGTDDAPSLAETVPDHHDRMRMAPEWADISGVMDHLPERERRIIYLRFFEDLSQSEIAERVGISQMHVSRLLRQTIDEIREMIGLDGD